MKLPTFAAIATALMLGIAAPATIAEPAFAKTHAAAAHHKCKPTKHFACKRVCTTNKAGKILRCKTIRVKKKKR
jgi:uncharacterized low-complexity protein